MKSYIRIKAADPALSDAIRDATATGCIKTPRGLIYSYDGVIAPSRSLDLAFLKDLIESSDIIATYGLTSVGKSYTVNEIMMYLLENYLCDVSAIELKYGLPTATLINGNTWTKIRDARSTRATAANDTSSRSHLIIKVKIVELLDERNLADMPERDLYILDLAGAEAMGENKNESIWINNTLLSLNKVMKALAYGSVPSWRETSLTKALHVMLKSYVPTPPEITLICCIDLATGVYDSTTLEFAATCKAVKRSNLVVDSILDKAVKWRKKIEAADPNAPELAELAEVVSLIYKAV